MSKPSTLFKYRQFDPKGYHLQLLTHNKVYFPSAAGLNDPFDSNVPFVIGTGTEQQVKDFFKRGLTLQYPSLNDAQIETMSDSLYSMGAHSNPVANQSMRKHIRDYTVATYGIFALSTKADQILMWSHYSNSHSGFVVAYDRAKMMDFFYNHHKSTGELIALEEVSYSTTFPSWNALTASPVEKMKNLLLVKSTDWGYEEEYRLIFHNGANKHVIIDDSIIDHVILGCQISDSDKSTIVSILKSKATKIKLRQASMKEDTYGLNFADVIY